MGWLQAIAAIAQLAVEMINLAYRLVRLQQEAKHKGWVAEGVSLANAIEKAETDEERAKLAKLLFSHRAK